MVTESEQQNARTPKMVGAAELLVQAGQAFKSGSPQMFVLAALGILIPQLLANWSLALPSANAARTLEQLTTAGLDDGQISPDLFTHIIETTGSFFTTFSLVTFVSWFVIGVTYLALVYLNLHQMRPWAFPALTPQQLLKDMGWLGLRRGLPLIFLITVTLAITQAFPLTAIFLASMTLMAPVLMVAEHKSALRSFLNSLTLSYARKTPLGGWSAFLGLVTVGGLVFTISFLIDLGANQLLEASTITGFDFLADKIPAFPFTWGFAAIDLIQTALISGIIALLPGFTTALYMRLHFRNRQKTVKIAV